MDDVMFLKVDVDDCEDIAAEYKVSLEWFSVQKIMNIVVQITAMPTFKFIKEGKEVADLTGANVEKLKEIVNSNK